VSYNKKAGHLGIIKVSKFDGKIIKCQKNAMSSRDFDPNSMSRISTGINNVKKNKPKTTSLLEIENISISNQKPCNSNFGAIKNFRNGLGKCVKGANFSAINKTATANFFIIKKKSVGNKEF